MSSLFSLNNESKSSLPFSEKKNVLHLFKIYLQFKYLCRKLKCATWDFLVTKWPYAFKYPRENFFIIGLSKSFNPLKVWDWESLRSCSCDTFLIIAFNNNKWATSWQNQQNDCVPGEESDQSSQCAEWVAKDTSFLHADSEDADQTGWMPRLICVFAGHTCHFVGFVMRRLKCINNINGHEKQWHGNEMNIEYCKPHLCVLFMHATVEQVRRVFGDN